MDDTERDLFGRGLRHVLTTHAGGALDTALADLGWPEALAAEPRVAVSTLFELQGATGATSAALDDVLAGALGMPAGEPPAVVLPALGRWRAPGVIAGDGLSVRGLATGAITHRPGALVIAPRHPVAEPGAGPAGPPEPAHVATTVPADLLTIRSVDGLDPALGLAEVTTDGPLAGGGPRPAPWAAALAAGRLALAHELVGATRAMLNLARGHAVDRVQFGRPIASFQAVRHRLADSLVAVEGAAAATDAAWDDPSPQASAIAKAAAGRAARTVAGHAQQVLAGVGFTTEHRFHRHLRRVLVLDGLLGSTRALTHELGEELLRTRRLALLPL